MFWVCVLEAFLDDYGRWSAEQYVAVARVGLPSCIFDAVRVLLQDMEFYVYWTTKKDIKFHEEMFLEFDFFPLFNKGVGEGIEEEEEGGRSEI